MVARIRAGEPDAYASLVRAHSGIAHRTAALLGAGAETEDVVQIAFVKAYRSLDRFRDGAAFRPWLLRIVANETRNALRALGRRAAAERRGAALDGLGAVAPEERLAVADASTAVLAGERRRELVGALRTLSEPHRQVLVCRFLLDLDEEETSAVLGWPRGTVKSRQHRALARLRARLAGAPDPDPDPDPDRDRGRGRGRGPAQGAGPGRG
ncbi:sigma-70 family RNA polymerase sigma factor, partial [Streptomyces sp. YIM 98790]|uniref:RNA polymerase sigma factor n=1 Tax=Streptomyces sp. YIM 98790 TaxID=2689077 RepID=UPI001409FDA3